MDLVIYDVEPVRDLDKVSWGVLEGGGVIQVADPPPKPPDPVIQLAPDGTFDLDSLRGLLLGLEPDSPLRAVVSVRHELNLESMKPGLEELLSTGHDVQLEVRRDG
jgi:hypothetical protein